MKISDRGIQFIESFEQYAPTPYQDQAGNWTWGYGHKQLPGEPLPSFVSHRQAVQLLDSDLQWAEHAINYHVQVALAQHQFDALTSFVFNVGVGAFYESTLLRVLNDGDYNAAAAQFLRWVYVNINGRLVVSNGLLARRRAESAMFARGVYEFH